MKVLIECSGVGAGGITRYVSEVAKHWPTFDDVELVTWDSRLAASVAPRCTITQVDGASRSRRLVATSGATFRRARSWPADVVLSPAPSFLPPLGRTPRILVLHDLFFRLVPSTISMAQRRYREAAYRAAMRQSAALVCVSERTRHDLQGWQPEYAAKAIVIPNAVTDIFRAEPRWRGDLARKTLLVPAHNELKGTELVLFAMQDLPDWSCQLLAGSSQRSARLQVRIQELGLGSRVTVVGHLSDELLKNAMVESSALLLPSDIEGFGLPALEAMACDVPVVVSPDPALREATNGMAVTMRDWTPEAVVAAVGEIEGTPPERWREAGDWARRRVWGDVAQDLREVCARSLTTMDPG